MKRICVFCGSNPGASPAYARAAAGMGALLAGRGLTLVYGGGRVGLMGVLADSVLAAGGRVIGVIPNALKDRELGHAGLTELRVVSSMHERKALMAELADGFIALPGGIGTMEEWFEVWTWGQLGIHAKPLGLLDVEGYFDPLHAFLDRMVTEHFLTPAYRAMALVEEDPEVLLDRMAEYVPPQVRKWLERSEG
jgi:uncharacterized protein (TIGR00730 family)